MKYTGAQIVVECLIEQGVDTVFGYPGGAILNIYDELYKEVKTVKGDAMSFADLFKGESN